MMKYNKAIAGQSSSVEVTSGLDILVLGLLEDLKAIIALTPATIISNDLNYKWCLYVKRAKTINTPKM